MKQITLVLMFFVFVRVQAQNYQISFAGSGTSFTIDSVQAENLTQCKSISLSGSDILNLNVTNGINELGIRNEELGIKLYPNPMTDYCLIDFEATAQGGASISLYDITGKRIAQVKEFLTKGQHTYKLSGISSGIYVLKVESAQYTYSAKIVSGISDFGLGTAELRHELHELTRIKTESSTSTGSLSISSGTDKSLKGNKSYINWQYTAGDTLKLTGFSGIYSTVYMLVPKQTTQTITFNFIACTDGDNNNYTVVQVGTQIWMEENLKTTKYNDGSGIPLVTDNTAWAQLSTSGYCWYNDSNKYKSIYGALYNWFAVNTGKLCPTGWHVPDTAEWNTLVNYLGGWNIAGGKMKEACSKLWVSPNTGATNSSGISALPGGGRSNNGNFDGQGINGGWWSATEYDATDAWHSNLFCYGPSAYLRRYDYKENGFSVRCVRD